jgi:HSP20 family protein
MKEATAIERARERMPLKLVSFDDLFERINKTQESIARRAFELFESNGKLFGRDLDDWFKAESELLHPSHVEVTESDAALAVRAEVPGFEAKELEVSVEPRRLTISGKRETKEERKTQKTIYAERCADQILRVIDLPAEVDTAKVTATLKDGILELGMPKAAPAKKVKVEPKAA